MADVCEAVKELQQLEYVTRVSAVALPKQAHELPQQTEGEPVTQPNELYPTQLSFFSTDLAGMHPDQAVYHGTWVHTTMSSRHLACFAAMESRTGDTEMILRMSSGFSTNMSLPERSGFAYCMCLMAVIA